MTPTLTDGRSAKRHSVRLIAIAIVCSIGSGPALYAQPAHSQDSLVESFSVGEANRTNTIPMRTGRSSLMTQAIRVADASALSQASASTRQQEARRHAEADASR
jgi:hypothetical protein